MLPCMEVVPGPPAMAAYPFDLGGQQAWSHEEGFPAGWFHTYDALDVGAPAALPHKVHVFLPRDYDPCGAGHPVVYMNDGGSAFWPGGAANKSWDVATTLGKLVAEGAIEPVMVVAIEPVDRNSEYTHVQEGPGETCCEVEAYTSYVADAVKGFIDSHYRTKPARKSTAIVGSSRGGLAAFYLANRRPEVFGHAACMSPSFWAGLDPVFGGNYPGGPLATSPLVTTLQSTLSDPTLRPRLWIDWGLIRTGGNHNALIEAAATERGKEMVALLQSSYGYKPNEELFWEEDAQGEHDEISWGRRFPRVMKAFFGK
jgi:pimeloyl-ACP methyl ester carboxylesterase